MTLEGQGIPTVTLCTEEFEALARLRLEAMGLPADRVAAIPHPLAGLPPDAVRARAVAVLPRIVQAFASAAGRLEREDDR